MKKSDVLTETVEAGSNFERGFNVLAQDSGPFQRSLEHMKQRNDKLMGMATPSGSRSYREYDETATINNS